MIVQDNQDYLVYIPDLSIFTEGSDYADAIRHARDAMGLKLITTLDEGIALPLPSSYAAALEKTKAEADDSDFRYSDGLLTLVDVDVEEYRKKHDRRMVKKNCTIPYYLDEMARREGINFSRLLQEALLERLAQ